MTKAELLEAIQSTITSNGQKGITAESLANILVEMVNVVPEEKEEAGSGQVVFYLGTPNEETGEFVLTPEQQVHNAKMFEVVKNAEPCVLASVDVSDFYNSMMPSSVPGLKYCTVCATTSYMPGGDIETEGGTDNIPECVALLIEPGEFAVLADGSVLAMS